MYLMIQKESIDSDTCIIMLNFAENYQNVLQDEILSFHWDNSQCCIHQDKSNVSQEKPFGFISENLKHDTVFVYEVTSKGCEFVKGSYMHITKTFF